MEDTGKMADTLIKLGEKDALKSVKEDVSATRQNLDELGAKIEERKQTMQVSMNCNVIVLSFAGF